MELDRRRAGNNLQLLIHRARVRVGRSEPPDLVRHRLRGLRRRRLLPRHRGLVGGDDLSYQGTHYAGDYASFVETVRTAEENAVPGSTVVAEAVAT